ncbi:hypothetical protein FB45DRAFT_711197, partial [Roridomyces roridus]
RVGDLWFPDGSLVIQAGNCFRVASSVLAARSSVFRDMLAIPQPETKVMIGGCPMVVLHDSGEETKYFLKAIFDSSFSERPPKPTTYPIITGVLRLRTKYDVGYLRQRALLHLASASLLSLEDYDDETLGSNDPICHLVLADSLGLQWAMLTALYHVSRVENIDPIPSDVYDLSPLSPTSAFAYTAAPDPYRAYVCTALLYVQARDTFRFLRAPQVPGCSAQHLCPLMRARWLSALLGMGIVDPLTCFDEP